MISYQQFESLFEQAANKLMPSRRTLLGRERLKNAGWSVMDVHERQIQGSIVECGTFRGGSLAFMCLVNQQIESDRTAWGFDTFSGIPVPTEKDGAGARGRGFQGDLLATEKDCRQTLSLLDINMDRVKLVPGLFQDTLPAVKNEIGPISVLRLDGDWYDSTMCCLENLYDQVTPGGWILIDDYGHWEGCKKAVDEFLAKRNLSPQIKKTDYTEICWKK